MCLTSEYWLDELCASDLPKRPATQRVKPEQSNAFGPVAPDRYGDPV
jgi:hypothetical protein